MTGRTATGGQLIVEGLVTHGVDLAFTVAGESYLEVLDAAVDAPSLRLITCRQEGGAAFMAEAVGKLSHRPGVAMVTRGPGACNAAIGVHTAHQDSTPMVLLVGQVARGMMDREAFQEVDFRKMFAPLAKWVAQIDQAERIPEYLGQAFQVATSGRPGPVVLALPEDMLRDRVVVKDRGAYQPVRAHPGAADLARLRALLAEAKRPMLLVGGGGWTDEAAADVQRFALANDIPVCSSFRRQDVIDNRVAVWAGDLGTGANPALVRRLGEADLVIAVGARLGEITTQSYSALAIPEPQQRLIHIHPAAEELGRVMRPVLGIQAGMPEAAAALAQLDPVAGSWGAWRAAARADYDAQLVPTATSASLDLGQCMRRLDAHLPDDSIITIDAGNFSGWAQRFLSYRRPGRQLGPTSGAMGYSVPAGVAAKIRRPGARVVSFVGDGGFLMTGQELATACQEAERTGGGPIILVFDNGMYGTIRMHQERRFPGRVSATRLHNPDFVALARSYGAFGAKVEETDQFMDAVRAAEAHGGPAVLHLAVPPEQITTRQTIAELQAQSRARLAAGKGFEEHT
ncbi:MAG: thiamine pyrophosphate-binding protein [Alphaproteobacteria bacterium]|nr:MAG: thiamine pyrophosphate-binding protein [Alphaproteobacteria bacterium]